MSVTALTASAVEVPKAGIDESHYCCCRDVNIALCGVDLTEHTFEPTCAVSCVVCTDLEANNFCPRRTDGCEGPA